MKTLVNKSLTFNHMKNTLFDCFNSQKIGGLIRKKLGAVLDNSELGYHGEHEKVTDKSG